MRAKVPAKGLTFGAAISAAAKEKASWETGAYKKYVRISQEASDA
jgi:hypothetical protein